MMRITVALALALVGGVARAQDSQAGGPQSATAQPPIENSPSAPAAPDPPTPAGAGADTLPPGAPPVTPRDLADRRPSRLRSGAWASAAATVLMLSAGVLCGLAAQERADEITRQPMMLDASRQPPTYTAERETRHRALESEGTLYNGLAISLMAASAAAAVVSTVLFVLDRRAAPDAEEAGRVVLLPSLGPAAGALSARVRF